MFLGLLARPERFIWVRVQSGPHQDSSVSLFWATVNQTNKFNFQESIITVARTRDLHSIGENRIDGAYLAACRCINSTDAQGYLLTLHF